MISFILEFAQVVAELDGKISGIITSLEEKIKAKDEEIKNLKDESNDLHEKLKKLTDYINNRQSKEQIVIQDKFKVIPEIIIKLIDVKNMMSKNSVGGELAKNMPVDIILVKPNDDGRMVYLYKGNNSTITLYLPDIDNNGKLKENPQAYITKIIANLNNKELTIDQMLIFDLQKTNKK
ncbi:MAG: hypothetical protein M1538_01205 [Candidatus Marsarchaeota archaeon]|nr:hypothetical protein [Candidatus Marsarchaeota archaeon]